MSSRLHVRAETDLGRMEYSDQGSGTAVVLFHGGQSSAVDPLLSEVFDPARYRLVTPSRPGYRGTPLGIDASAAGTADRVCALLDVLGISRALIVAASLGGRPAIEFAARHPERTLGLVLGSAVTGPWMTDAQLAKNRAAFAPGVEQLVWAAVRATYRLAPRRMERRFLAQLTTRTPPPLGTADAAALRRKIFSLRSYRGFANDLTQSVAVDTLRAVRCPTLIQHSTSDNSVPRAHAERAQTAIAGARLRTYDNDWGHFIWNGPGSDQAVADLRAFAGCAASGADH